MSEPALRIYRLPDSISVEIWMLSPCIVTAQLQYSGWHSSAKEATYICSLVFLLPSPPSINSEYGEREIPCGSTRRPAQGPACEADQRIGCGLPCILACPASIYAPSWPGVLNPLHRRGITQVSISSHTVAVFIDLKAGAATLQHGLAEQSPSGTDGLTS